MLVLDRVWREIREQFSAEEKRVLREAIAGEVICPSGWEIDIESVPEALSRKLTEAVLAAHPPR